MLQKNLVSNAKFLAVDTHAQSIKNRKAAKKAQENKIEAANKAQKTAVK